MDRLTPSPYWSPAPVPRDLSVLAGGARVAGAFDTGDVRLAARDGSAWEPLPPLPDAAYVTSLLASRSTLFAGTVGRGIWRRTADGWSPSEDALSERTVVALAARGSVILAGTLRAGLFRSLDGGRSWTRLSEGLPLRGEGLEILQVVATPRAWYALHPFGVSESRDAGRAWRSVVAGLPPRRSPTLLATLGMDVFAAVEDAVYILDTSPRWQRTGGSERIRLLGAAGGRLWCVRRTDGRLLQSADLGASWIDGGEGLPSAPLSALAATRRTLYVQAEGSGLWQRALVNPNGAPEALLHIDLAPGEPNPFADRTVLAFTLSERLDVLLTVRDVRDVEVARLAEGVRTAGTHRVAFDAREVPAGIYAAHLVAGGRVASRSLVRLG